MTRRVWLPPTLEDDVDDVAARVRALEDRLVVDDEPAEPRFVVFDKPGPLIGASESNPYEHPTGARLIRARLKLKVASETDPTVFHFSKNGTEFFPVHTSGGTSTPEGEILPSSFFVVAGFAVLPPGKTSGVAFFTGARFGPDVDELVIGVAPGSGASGLLVRTEWAR